VTLLEILVVMVLLALVVGTVIAGSGQLASVRLKRAATMVTGAVRVAFTRATATSKPHRIVFDMDEDKIWLEEGDTPMLVQAKDITGTGGADAVTVAEQVAVKEGQKIMQGPTPARPHYHAVNSLGFASLDFADENAKKGPRLLGRGIKYREIQAMHDEHPRTTGRAYLYFWPGGQTERASIQLRIGESTQDHDAITLMIAPLTGRVTVKSGAVSLVIPTDDKESSDREDKAGF
jgi:general secretion pathway protein H